MMQNHQLHILVESARYVVGHIFEATIAVEKATGREIDLGSHYGDPAVALIGPDEAWFLVGGEGLTYFSEPTGMREFLRNEPVGEENSVAVRYENGAGQGHSFDAVAARERKSVFVGHLEQLPFGEVAVYGAEEPPSVWIFDGASLTIRPAPTQFRE